MCEKAKKTKKVKTEKGGRKPICMRKSHGLKKGRDIDEESKPYFLRSNRIKSRSRARVCDKVTQIKEGTTENQKKGRKFE